MGQKRYKPEEIIGKLREAEVLLAKGHSTEKILRQLGVSENTYYHWRQEYGGLRVDQAKRLKYLEKENARLKKVVANLTLDVDILRIHTYSSLILTVIFRGKRSRLRRAAPPAYAASR